MKNAPQNHHPVGPIGLSMDNRQTCCRMSNGIKGVNGKRVNLFQSTRMPETRKGY
jgi:hypothetical protein